jgi:S1-C subfamily serine protease
LLFTGINIPQLVLTFPQEGTDLYLTQPKTTNMQPRLRQHLYEFSFLILLMIGAIAIAQAQDQNDPADDAPLKRVRVQVEITENGKTSTSIQELDLDIESINGQLEEMVEEIEMILEEALRDVEETDLEITIKRNTIGESIDENDNPQYRTYMSVIPESLGTWDVESEPKAFFGVNGKSLSESDLAELGVDKALVLSNVVEGSSADKAGFESGDIIYTIGREDVGSFEELSHAVKSHKPGATVDIDMSRGGVRETKPVTFGANAGTHYQYKRVQKPFLGIRGRDDQNGALIESVIDGTAADDAHLQANDVIVEVGGESISSYAELGEALQSKEIGESVNITILRDGVSEEIEVELGEQYDRQDVSIVMNKPDHNYHYNYSYDYDFDDLEENDSEAAFLGIVGKSDDKGVLVTKVFEGSTAEKIGLKENDIIRSLDGNKVDDVDDLVEHLNDSEAGDDIKVNFERDGKKMKESGSLGSKTSHCEQIKMASAENGNVKKIVMHVRVEELDEAEIEELANKSGQDLDASNSLELSELQFSPNPSNGQFKLMFDVPKEGDTEIRIFDQNGQTLVTQELKSFSGIYSNQMDISDQPAGVYFISITQNGKGKTSRVVKQ